MKNKEKASFCLTNLIKVIRNSLVILILILIAGGVFGFGYAKLFAEGSYVATTKLLVASQADETNIKIANDCKEIIMSDSLVEEVMLNLTLQESYGIDNEQYKEMLDVTAASDSDILLLSVSNDNPELAAMIANQVATSLTEELPYLINIDNITILTSATIPLAITIDTTKYVIIGLLVALVICFVIIIIRCQQKEKDKTIDNASELEQIFGYQVLATIPQLGTKENQNA